MWFLTDKSGNADMANQPSPASRALLWVIENNNDEEYLVENIDQQKRSLGALARTDWLERIFKLRQHGSSVKIELIAGLTTFVTMAYIIFVNPNVMAAAGLDHGAAFVATCLGAALGCLLMGFYANWPVGLAPGMGLNASDTEEMLGGEGRDWLSSRELEALLGTAGEARTRITADG